MMFLRCDDKRNAWPKVRWGRSQGAIVPVAQAAQLSDARSVAAANMQQETKQPRGFKPQTATSFDGVQLRGTHAL